MERLIIKIDNLYGVVDGWGLIVVEPFFDNIRQYSNGLAAVCKDGKWGYIDHEGDQVIDLLYDYVRDFSLHGVAAVKLNENMSRWALIKDNGQLIKMEDEIYYNIGDFNPYGYAIARAYQGYHIIDKDGKQIDNKVYSSLEYVKEKEIFLAERIGIACMINIEGQVVIEPEDDYDEIYFPSSGLCQVSKDDKSGYINQAGSLVIPLKYKYVWEFAENGLAYVENDDGKGGYINKDDEFIIDPIFQSGTIFEHARAAVSIEGEYFFIDEKGKRAIDASFKYASSFSQCGLAKVELRDGRKGFIRPDGIIEFILEKGWDAEEFIGDKKITQVSFNGKVGLINNKGQVILEPSLADIRISPNSKLHPFKSFDRWGYMNDEGEVVIDDIYQEVSFFSENNLALVKIYCQMREETISYYINDREELVDARLIESFDLSFSKQFDKVYDFYNGLALATKKEKLEILNSYGQLLCS